MLDKPVIVILAGSRPGGDPLTDGQAFSSKALYPVAGTPMLAHVLNKVTAFQSDNIVVVAQNCDELRNHHEIAQYSGNVQWHVAQSTIAQTMRDLLLTATQPLLVTTADNVLLNQDILNEFMMQAGGNDLAVGAVAKTTVLNSQFQTKRTWLKLQDESWSGCNLFYLGGSNIMPLINSWAEIEQSRKKATRLFSVFGLNILLRFLFGRMTAYDFGKLLSKRYNITATIVPLSDARACIDADKIEDIALIESILCEQQI